MNITIYFQIAIIFAVFQKNNNMKRVFASLFIASAIMSLGCSQTPSPAPAADADAPVITFETTEHDFGTIEQGSDATFVFEFKNTGKSDLIISNAQASCGCTTPNWTKEPVAKKKKGLVTVKYNTGNISSFSKTVTVYSNASNSPIVLKIKGAVVAKAAAETTK
jgi:hypothetical protein